MTVTTILIFGFARWRMSWRGVVIEAFQLELGNRGLDESLDGADVVRLLRRRQSERVADGFRAAGSADAGAGGSEDVGGGASSGGSSGADGVGGAGGIAGVGGTPSNGGTGGTGGGAGGTGG